MKMKMKRPKDAVLHRAQDRKPAVAEIHLWSAIQQIIVPFAVLSFGKTNQRTIGHTSSTKLTGQIFTDSNLESWLSSHSLSSSFPILWCLGDRDLTKVERRLKLKSMDAASKPTFGDPSFGQILEGGTVREIEMWESIRRAKWKVVDGSVDGSQINNPRFSSVTKEPINNAVNAEIQD